MRKLQNSELERKSVEDFKQAQKTPIIMITTEGGKGEVITALKAGVNNYIVKPFNEKTLLASLEIAISNHAADNNKKMPVLTLDKINKHLLSPLSDREFEVVQLIYEGITNNQIAEKIFVSVNTVKTHLKNIYLKLDANTRYGVIVRLRELMAK